MFSKNEHFFFYLKIKSAGKKRKLSLSLAFVTFKWCDLLNILDFFLCQKEVKKKKNYGVAKWGGGGNGGGRRGRQGYEDGGKKVGGGESFVPSFCNFSKLSRHF